jgi:hypothetical protein
VKVDVVDWIGLDCCCIIYPCGTPLMRNGV